MVFYLESSNFFGTLKRKCCLGWVCPSTSLTKKNNRLMLLRLIFTLSIFLPTLAVYAHELSSHEHEECEEHFVHFHENNEECFLDNFLSTKIYNSSLNYFKALVFLFSTEIFEINVSNLKKIHFNLFQRGPPAT